jgi:hypothetical protein
MTSSTITANEQRDGSGFAVEPHPHHGAVERLAVVGSDYPPTVARLATASTARHGALPAKESRGKVSWPNQLHWRPQFVNLVEIISTMLAWRESSREELDMRCPGDAV